MKRECKLTPDRNPLATYTEKAGELRLSEQHLYGAKRLGMRNSNLLVASTDGHLDNSEDKGEKRYELTNHLGNVLAVVSGEKAADGSAQILSLTDMEMDGRKYVKLTADVGYRYGFNGQEKEIIKGAYIDFGARIYETRIAKFLTLDPLCEKYKSVSNYSFANSSPIYFIDSEGEKPKVAVILVTPEDISLFGQHERPLEKAGYIVVKVTNGEDLIKELSKNSTPEDPIKNLIILSHASPGGCSAGGRGLYTSYEIEDVRSKIVSADYKSNDEYKSYYSAIDVDDFVEAILKGDNIQTYDLTILLGGCSAAGKAKLDKQPIFAEQISKGLGDKVIAVYASQGKSCFKLEAPGNTDPDNPYDTRFRHSELSWRKYVDGKQVKTDSHIKTINIVDPDSGFRDTNTSSNTE